MILKYNVMLAMEAAQELVIAIRRVRQENRVRGNVRLKVFVEPKNTQSFTHYWVFAEEGFFEIMANADVYIALPGDLLGALEKQSRIA